MKNENYFSFFLTHTLYIPGDETQSYQDTEHIAQCSNVVTVYFSLKTQLYFVYFPYFSAFCLQTPKIDICIYKKKITRSNRVYKFIKTGHP